MKEGWKESREYEEGIFGTGGKFESVDSGAFQAELRNKKLFQIIFGLQNST